MRQRHIRNRDRIIEECGRFEVTDPAGKKGGWQGLFLADLPLRLEIGSGKGQFITGLAQRDCGFNYIACEGAYNVYPRILQKIDALKLDNVLVLGEYIADPCQFFEDGEISDIYLNFSDPWKKKYSSRRLTYRDKLAAYARVCRPGGHLEFKTDNDELFAFTLEEIEAVGLVPDIIEYDLHASPYNEANIRTEYEDKFTDIGIKIKFLRITFT